MLENPSRSLTPVNGSLIPVHLPSGFALAWAQRLSFDVWVEIGRCEITHLPSVLSGMIFY